MECQACRDRGKTWQGSDPTCGFDEFGVFNPENWNCATLNKLREIAYNDEPCIDHFEDTSLARIRIENDRLCGWVVLCWYKSRGRTGQALYIDEDHSEPLTLQDAEETIEYYKGKGNK